MTYSGNYSRFFGSIDWAEIAILEFILSTFNVAPALVAAAGTNQAGATVLTDQLNVVTSATSGSAQGVVATSYFTKIWNATSTPINVYPPSGAHFAALATNLPVALAPQAGIETSMSSTTQGYYLLTQVAASAPVVTRIADFRASLGVNVHIAAWVPPDATGSNVIDVCAYVGASVIRDHLSVDVFNIPVTQACVTAGLKLVLISTIIVNDTLVVADIITAANTYAAMGSSCIVALEGPNEPTMDNYTYAGATSSVTASPGFQPVADFCKAFRIAMNAAPALSALPYWSSTQCGFGSPSDTGLEFLTVQRTGTGTTNGSVLADVANIHVYPQYDREAQSVDASTGFNGFNNGLVKNFVQTFGDGAIGQGYLGYPSVSAVLGLPHVITEYGYPTRGIAAGGLAMSETIAGKNILTAWLNAWEMGFSHFIVYTLFDTFSSDDSASSLGLYNYDGTTAKLAATYLHNFTTVLADAGVTSTSFITTTLGFKVTGLPPGGKYWIFEASDGTFYIVLWNNVQNWNFAAGSAITIGATTVTITLQSSMTANLYNPTIGTASQATTTGTSVTVSLSDYPLIVKLA